MESKDGRFDIRLSLDQSQALATIYPPQENGKDVSLNDVLERLSRMNAGRCACPDEIRDGISRARASALPVEVVAAQGTLPKDGQDAKIRYTLPEDIARQPPPKHPQLPGAIDWFSMDSRHLVAKGRELASIVPSQPGVSGKTCTLPPKDIPYRPGKPANLAVGANVSLSPDGLYAYSKGNGYFYLHGERLAVIAFEERFEEVNGERRVFEKGAILHAGVQNAHLVAEDFLSIRGIAKNATLRAKGDILLQDAENCVIITSGNVFVEGTLLRCDVKTRQKAICAPSSQIIGGAVRARGGIVAGCAGTPDFEETALEVGADHYTPLRDVEIEQELVACNHNIQRIKDALKPFKNSAAHKSLTEERRQLIQQLHGAERAQEERIRNLREEKRRNVILAKERISATVEVQYVHPGVWVRSGRLQFLVESPLQNALFAEALRGTAIQVAPLEKAG